MTLTSWATDLACVLGVFSAVTVVRWALLDEGDAGVLGGCGVGSSTSEAGAEVEAEAAGGWAGASSGAVDVTVSAMVGDAAAVSGIGDSMSVVRGDLSSSTMSLCWSSILTWAVSLAPFRFGGSTSAGDEGASSQISCPSSLSIASPGIWAFTLTPSSGRSSTS